MAGLTREIDPGIFDPDRLKFFFHASLFKAIAYFYTDLAFHGCDRNHYALHAVNSRVGLFRHTVILSVG